MEVSRIEIEEDGPEKQRILEEMAAKQASWAGFSVIIDSSETEEQVELLRAKLALALCQRVVLGKTEPSHIIVDEAMDAISEVVGQYPYKDDVYVENLWGLIFRDFAEKVSGALYGRQLR